jgi:flagellar biosynthetic protein FliR
VERYPQHGKMILSVAQVEVFLFILARIVGVFIQGPLFSSRSFPAPAKLAFAIWLSIVLWFVTPISPVLPTSLVGFIVILVAELVLGFLLGFICNMLFLGVQAAGELIDMQMGLSVAQALDPVFGAVISVIGRLTFFVALIVFLILDGHHLLLSAFHHSFVVIPVGKPANFIAGPLIFQLFDVSALLWTTAIKIAAPAILLIFLSDFTFGIVSRVAPQVNVFMLGFQVKPMLGLFTIAITMPFIIKQIGGLILVMGQQVTQLLLILK